MPIVSQPLVMDQSAVEECADAYYQDIISRLDPKWFEEMKILDVRTAVNGLPGCKFIDSLNKQTSMGFPWRRAKINFMTQREIPTEPLSEEWDFDPEILERVDKIREKHLRGERA